MSQGTRAQRRGESVRPSKTGKQSSRWAANLAGDKPGEGLPGSAEQVGSQAEQQPTELPGGSRPSVLCMAQAQPTTGRPRSWVWPQGEEGLMEGGVQLTDPQLKRETCMARAHGDTHTAVPVSHQGRDPEQPSALSYGMDVEARKAGGAGSQSPGDE